MAKCAHEPELVSGSRFGVPVQWTRCLKCKQVLARPVKCGSVFTGGIK